MLHSAIVTVKETTDLLCTADQRPLWAAQWTWALFGLTAYSWQHLPIRYLTHALTLILEITGIIIVPWIFKFEYTIYIPDRYTVPIKFLATQQKLYIFFSTACIHNLSIPYRPLAFPQGENFSRNNYFWPIRTLFASIMEILFAYPLTSPLCDWN